MKNKSLYILLLAVLCAGIYLYASHAHLAKCPDDYADTDVGSTEYIADTNKWTNDFYDAYPEATLADWSAARYQFWVDNNCTGALERYREITSSIQ